MSRIANKYKSYIKNKYKCKVYVVGSIGRGEEEVKDIDLLLITKKKLDLEIPNSVLKLDGKYHKQFYLKKYKKNLDIFITHPKYKIFALFHYQSPRRYVIRVRKQAKRLGYKLNQYGLFRGKERVYIKSERHLVKKLGLHWRKLNDR